MKTMYSIRENPPKEIQQILNKYDLLTQRLLFSRGITTEEEADLFLKKEWLEINPNIYKDMQKGTDRILDAIEKKEKIGIYSDYDCDGVPAAAALYSTLKAFDHQEIEYYVPDRNVDGFGVNERGVEKLIKSGVSVVCVLDCGTSSPEGIDKFNEAGVDVIIIDHHLPGEICPKPFAMINPTIEDGVEEPYPCTAGLIYIFIQSLIYTAQERENILTKPKIGWEKWQLDIISLATISDMVPLKGMNRQFAHYGLEVARKSPRPGVQALCRELKIKQQNIRQDDLVFLIIPRINAASRMGDAMTAFKLLTTSDFTEALKYAKHLTNLNNKRKTTVATNDKRSKQTDQIKR